MFGDYHLDKVYDLSVFQELEIAKNEVVSGVYAENSKVFMCQEQDDMGDEDPEHTYHDRAIVVTSKCLLVFKPANAPMYGILQFWATL